MIDSHAHLDTPSLAADLPGILERAKEAGLTHIINVGERISSSQDSIQLAQNFDHIFAVVGVHPQNALELQNEENKSALEKMLAHPKVKAMGEIGLDYHWIDPDVLADKETQVKAFEWQLALAKKYNLPVVIHSRDAAEDTFNIIQNAGLPKVVMHCYAYDTAWAEKFLALNENYLISLTGIVTFPNAKITQDVAKNIPLEHLTVETDSPFLAPQKYRGKTNEPAFVVEVARKISELKRVALEEVETQTDANIKAFFAF